MPEAPQQPLALAIEESATFTANGQTTLHLKWKEPREDGGTTVIDYKIEM